MALKFDDELVPAIQDGRVTMQFGVWRRPRVVAGRVYVVKGLGVLRVTAVEKVNLSRLTPWEAEAAGAKDLPQLREWLLVEDPDLDMKTGTAYRVRFRYLGPETKEEGDEEGTEEEGEGAAEEEDGRPSPVKPKAIPPHLMEWMRARPWRCEHLQLLTDGIWRNADDLSSELDVDSATTRRRMGDLRKRGLVTSHRHHGYRITPEGQGALAGMVVDEGEGEASSAGTWLRAKPDRMQLIETLQDGRWHNAAEVAEALGLSVVSVQRRVAAMRDRGLVESHRRRGYRLTDAGFESLGRDPAEARQEEETKAPPEPAKATPPEPEAPAMPEAPSKPVAPPRGKTAAETTMDASAVTTDAGAAADAAAADAAEEPIPSALLEWLGKKDYRGPILLMIPDEDYVSSTELSERLTTSVTALHGRLKTLKDRGLIVAKPRRGYTMTPLGVRVATVLRAMTSKGSSEPAGAAAFLSAESPGWSAVSARAPAAPTLPGSSRIRTRWGSRGECGFCHATESSAARQGWVQDMQTHLEPPDEAGRKGRPLECRRGVFEDGSWFLVVERDPLAEGHCKLICKEHVTDLIELAEWSFRDHNLAAARDSLSRDLMVAVEAITGMDPRIVDVLVVSGLEIGSHLHFDLIPRYRLDPPGLRPIASSRAYFDDLSLVRKRRLWAQRTEHLEEIAYKVRQVAEGIVKARGLTGLRITTFD